MSGKDAVFRQDHAAMRAGARRPVSGPAADDHLAASGGLELPGGHESSAEVSAAPDRERIPGERDPETLVATQPGAVGGAGFGTQSATTDPHVTMDQQTVIERRKEGEGG